MTIKIIDIDSILFQLSVYRLIEKYVRKQNLLNTYEIFIRRKQILMNCERIQ